MFLATLVLALAFLFLRSDDTAPIAKPAPPPAPAPIENLAHKDTTDPVEVFRRAFWREPAADDRILHAERREWLSEENGVRRWRWFLAVQPGPALAKWLRDEDPFLLRKVERPDSARPPAEQPAWFPGATILSRCTIEQSADCAMTFIFDPAQNTLYATDAGHGFTFASQRPVEATAPSPAGSFNRGPRR